MKTTIIITVSILFMTAFPGYAQTAQPPELTERKLVLQADQLEHFVSHHGNGTLRLRGEDGRDEIEVLARIAYYSEDDIEFSLEAHNERAVLEAGFIGGQYSGPPPYIDLVIMIPNRFSAELISEAGDIEVSNLQGMVTIDNAAGNVFAENTGGIRVIKGSEGTVRTRDINGPVQISQRSSK